MKAWLIRWRGISEDVADLDPIVTILSARASERKVKWYLEQRYNETWASFHERLAYARYTRPSKPAYPAQVEAGKIHCGHDPFLEAKLVDNVWVETDSDGNETLRWR